jgi:hypothetical protein
MLIALLLAAQAWRFDAGPAPRVEIGNVAGSIVVQGEDRADVTVEAFREGGSEEEQRRWAVEIDGNAEGVTAHACCGGCERTRRRCGDESVSVRFEVHVPRRARVFISSLSGDVQVRGVEGEEHVETVSGRIELSPAQVAEIGVSSVSGAVRLRLPRGADARVSLSTVSGRMSGRKVFGRGTARIQVATVSGDIDVDD